MEEAARRRPRRKAAKDEKRDMAEGKRETEKRCATLGEGRGMRLGEEEG